jgi:hypothetical protein
MSRHASPALDRTSSRTRSPRASVPADLTSTSIVNAFDNTTKDLQPSTRKPPNPPTLQRLLRALSRPMNAANADVTTPLSTSHLSRIRRPAPEPVDADVWMELASALAVRETRFHVGRQVLASPRIAFPPTSAATKRERRKNTLCSTQELWNYSRGHTEV